MSDANIVQPNTIKPQKWSTKYSFWIGLVVCGVLGGAFILVPFLQNKFEASEYLSRLNGCFSENFDELNSAETLEKSACECGTSPQPSSFTFTSKEQDYKVRASFYKSIRQKYNMPNAFLCEAQDYIKFQGEKAIYDK